MKDYQQIKDLIAKLESDDRHKYPPALVDINAPLALIQVEIQAKIDTLKWVLGE